MSGHRQRLKLLKFSFAKFSFFDLPKFTVTFTMSCLRDSIKEFQLESVKMRDPLTVENKLQQIKKNGGIANLQVIMDFDATITRYESPSSHFILENGCIKSEEIKKKLNGFFEKYRPIETSGKLTTEEKIPYMIQWYTESHEVLLSSLINKSDIRQAVHSAPVLLRDQVITVFKLLNDLNVPLLVFSAGIGDVVEEILRRFDCYYPNVKVVSNFMDFDENGRMKGFKGETIHVFNKDESVLANHSEYFETLVDKSNIILLGDNLGDLNMSNGHKKVHSVLKIGYLNTKIEENLEQYLLGFDILLVADGTMDLLLGILKKLQL